MARLSERPELLGPWHELWTNQAFQQVWVEMTRSDLQSFKEVLWTVNPHDMPVKERKIWDEVLCLPPLNEAGDWELALRCLRAVCGYFEWRLNTIERHSKKYEALMQAEVKK